MRSLHLVLLLLLPCAQSMYAQELKPTRDFGCWAGLAIEKKLGNGFKIGVEQQFRTWHNSSKLDDYFLDVGLRYVINKHFRLGGSIRYIYDTKRSKETENNYRYSLDIEYKCTLAKKIKAVYRLRYQKEYVNLFLDYADNKIYYSAIRNKVAFFYDINKAHEVYLTAELFRLMEIYRRPYFDKIRFEIGDEAQLKIGEVNYSLGIEKELNSKYPYSFFFLKLIYTLEL